MIGLQIKIGNILGYVFKLEHDMKTGRAYYELWHPDVKEAVVGNNQFWSFDSDEIIKERILHSELPNWPGDVHTALQLFAKEDNWILRRVGNLYTFHLLSHPEIMGKDEQFPSMAVCDLFVKIHEAK